MRIRKLSEAVVAKIAAGEVVENPASVVRELIENAIDAGATEIHIHIEGGGKKRIRVQDNGVGMTREELPLAVQRFTTSKIASLDDLQNIRTLGFRGEALYAIASVSHLTLTSRMEGEETGWRAVFEAGELSRLEPAPHPVGTTVDVRDLFYNYPARRHFLSSDPVEARRCIETVAHFILAHPHIAFVLTVEDQEVYRLDPAPDRKTRAADLFGPDWISEMLWVERTFGNIVHIEGYVSKPDHLRDRPQVQDFFVNGRRIRDDALRKAVTRAYETASKYPGFLLFLDVAPDRVDFNIHPQKLQVRFQRSVRIFEKVLKTVQEGLRQHRGTVQPRLEIVTMPASPFQRSVSGEQMEMGEMAPWKHPRFWPSSAQGSSAPTPASTPATGTHAVPLFQMHNTYIVAQIASGLVIIDQHVAHERILYERLKNREIQTKMLLFPLVLDLPVWALKWVEENQALLQSAGFDIERLSGSSIAIKGVPEVFQTFDRQTFLELLEDLKAERRLPDRVQGLYKTIACKAAIKAGDPLSPEEMASLVDQLFATENPYHCPHGRPVLITLTLDELERKFGRK